jgi:hypothetical protein
VRRQHELFEGAPVTVPPCGTMRIKPTVQVRANSQKSLFSLDEGRYVDRSNNASLCYLPQSRGVDANEGLANNIAAPASEVPLCFISLSSLPQASPLPRRLLPSQIAPGWAPRASIPLLLAATVVQHLWIHGLCPCGQFGSYGAVVDARLGCRPQKLAGQLSRPVAGEVDTEAWGTEKQPWVPKEQKSRHRHKRPRSNQGDKVPLRTKLLRRGCA